MRARSTFKKCSVSIIQKAPPNGAPENGIHDSLRRHHSEEMVGETSRLRLEFGSDDLRAYSRFRFSAQVDWLGDGSIILPVRITDNGELQQVPTELDIVKNDPRRNFESVL